MLYGIVLVFHIAACIALIAIVLIQAGRGGGLAQSFSQAESIFGTKTNAFLTNTTKVLAVVFFITCLSLALMSKQRSRSLLDAPGVLKQSSSSQEKKDSTPKTEEAKKATNVEDTSSKTATTKPDGSDNKTVPQKAIEQAVPQAKSTETNNVVGK